MRNLTELLTACENQLGWQAQPRPGQPAWKIRSAEVRKLKLAMAARPKHHTLANLHLALEYSRRKRMPIASPLSLIHRIDEALALAPDPAGDAQPDIEIAIRDAITREKLHDDEHTRLWITRLVRCQGPGRFDVLAEWREAGRA